MSDLALSIKKLMKIYKNDKREEVYAINNLNLDIPKGSCCGLLGSNGAGKSTLINILGGSVNKTSGLVKVLGYDLDTHMDFIKYNLGIVPQELYMDLFFPIKDSLDVYSGLYGINKKNIKSDQILKILGLLNKKNIAPKHLSGGMKRRFLIAKALVNSPQILILDEPTAGVDIMLRDKIWSYIKHLKSLGRTIILITHYFQEAENLCDYFAFMKNGSVFLHGNREKIFNNNSLRIKKLDVSFFNFVQLDNVLSEYHYNFYAERNVASIFYSKDEDVAIILACLINQCLPIKSVNTCGIDLEAFFKEVIC